MLSIVLKCLQRRNRLLQMIPAGLRLELYILMRTIDLLCLYSAAQGAEEIAGLPSLTTIQKPNRMMLLLMRLEGSSLGNT